MKNTSIKKDIAIIGMSGKFPQSKNIEQFWKNLQEGQEMIHFYSELELKELGINSKEKDPNFVGVTSRIDDAECFDYQFFGYTKDEAEIMDPQTRLLHEHIWLALEDSGTKTTHYGGKIGLYTAVNDNFNWRLHAKVSNNNKVNPFYANQLSNRSFANTLISYKLNLKGPSLIVDTACSSSLAAVHMACRNLLLKECSIAVTGGVKILTRKETGYNYEEGMIYSKDGHCRAFDESSSGIVNGEGIGIVVLKRLEDALRDRDNIYSVIRGTALNNDGNRKVGYTAPSVQGQYECINLAHRMADVTPESIGYIETHGTATKLGDPIEIEALNKAFNYDTNHSCAIGSVKTNIGHLDSAAGIAGLIKATMVINQKSIPESLHFKIPNPQINFKKGPFYVNTKQTAWNNHSPLRAGVSAFGIGGNNVHVILEEAPERAASETNNPYYLLRYSAKSQWSLDKFQENLKTFLATKKDTKLADLAYTLQTGRDQFKYNRFLVCKSKEEALKILESEDQDGLFSGKLKNTGKVAFMCSGSGSQYLNMGKDLYHDSPYFKEYIDKGFAYLERETGIDYGAILFPNEQSAQQTNNINDNIHTQPLVFVFEYAVAKTLMHLGINPNYLIGHSTGEYVAACLSGIFTFEAALSLLIKRGELMSAAPKGSMLSVSLSKEKITAYLNSDVGLAVINSPESCVVSGTIEGIDALKAILEEKDIACSRIRVSLAGHSFLLDSILKEFEEAFRNITLSEPTIPVLSNYTGEILTKEEATSVTYWVNHLRNTVQFSKGLQQLLTIKNLAFLEIGPGNALTSVFKQHSKENIHDHIALNMLRHPSQEINDTQFFLQQLGELWFQGIDINWESYYGDYLPNKISAPAYVFHQTKFLARVNPLDNLNGNAFNTFEYEVEDNFNEDEEMYKEDADRELMNTPYKEPSTDTEKQLVEIWQDFFSINKIGILDDFFALGGNSLKGVTMLKLIQKTFEIDIKIKDFYKKSTIKGLAAEIDLALKFVIIQEEEISSKMVITI
ncbi:type I polyketide synthase [Flavobacterium sp. UGB4466]|uniref:type I polyketide synthase n=1 Tax=Flavobacterium sp. UGB4466 TaxID=2730889 RepID=UPI00192C9C46|nr:type I polyketide synthase [Flavobacterium sp. UGB4466]